MAYIQQFNLQEYLARTRAAQQATRDTGSGLDYNELLQQQYARTNAPVGQQVNAPSQTQEKGPGALEVGFDTVADFANNVLTGLFGLPEGIIDFLAGGVAAVGDYFGAETSGIQDFIKNTWADDAARLSLEFSPFGMLTKAGDVVVKSMTNQDFNFGEYAQEVMSGERFADDSLLRGNQTGEFIAGVAQGIGQLLPAIALQFLPGAGQAITIAGLSTNVTVGSAISIGAFSTSAGGKSIEAALNEGADIGAALAYGSASALTEGLIESLSGGVAGRVSGPFKVMAEKVIGKQAYTKIMSNAIAEAAFSAFAEGTEEFVSELIDPALRSITINPGLDYFGQFNETLTNGLTSFASSFISSFVVNAGGAITAGQEKVNGKKIGTNNAFTWQTYKEREYGFRQAQQRFEEKVRQIEQQYPDEVFIENPDGAYSFGDKNFNIDETKLTSYDINELKQLKQEVEVARQEMDASEQEAMNGMRKQGITEEDINIWQSDKLGQQIFALEAKVRKTKDEAKKNKLKLEVDTLKFMRAKIDGKQETSQTVSETLKNKKIKVESKVDLTQDEKNALNTVGYGDATSKINYTRPNGKTGTILFDANDNPLNFIRDVFESEQQEVKEERVATEKPKKLKNQQLQEAPLDFTQPEDTGKVKIFIETTESNFANGIAGKKGQKLTYKTDATNIKGPFVIAVVDKARIDEGLESLTADEIVSWNFVVFDEVAGTPFNTRLDIERFVATETNPIEKAKQIIDGLFRKVLYKGKVYSFDEFLKKNPGKLWKDFIEPFYKTVKKDGKSIRVSDYQFLTTTDYADNVYNYIGNAFIRRKILKTQGEKIVSTQVEAEKPKKTEPKKVAKNTGESLAHINNNQEVATLAQQYKMRSINHLTVGQETDVVAERFEYGDEDLSLADLEIVKANKLLKRKINFSNKQVVDVIRKTFLQVNSAEEVVVIGTLKTKYEASKSNAWATQFARQQRKTIYLYDEKTKKWYQSKNGSTFKQLVGVPKITSENISIHTETKISKNGMNALKKAFEVSFTKAGATKKAGYVRPPELRGISLNETPKNEKTYLPIANKIKLVTNPNGKQYTTFIEDVYTKGDTTYRETRAIVLVEIEGNVLPFYLSFGGESRKQGVTPGRWYPIAGVSLIHRLDGSAWLIKGSSEDIRRFYGSKLFRAVSEYLDDNIGDIRKQITQEVAQLKEKDLTEEEINFFNSSVNRLLQSQGQSTNQKDWQDKRDEYRTLAGKAMFENFNNPSNKIFEEEINKLLDGQTQITQQENQVVGEEKPVEQKVEKVEKPKPNFITGEKLTSFKNYILNTLFSDSLLSTYDEDAASFFEAARNDKLVLDYLYFSALVRNEELAPNEGNQTKLKASGNWRQFSLQRGYSEQNITNFEHYQKIAKKMMEKYGDDIFEFDNPNVSSAVYDYFYGEGAYNLKKKSILGEVEITAPQTSQAPTMNVLSYESEDIFGDIGTNMAMNAQEAIQDPNKVLLDYEDIDINLLTAVDTASPVTTGIFSKNYFSKQQRIILSKTQRESIFNAFRFFETLKAKAGFDFETFNGIFDIFNADVFQNLNIKPEEAVNRYDEELLVDIIVNDYETTSEVILRIKAEMEEDDVDLTNREEVEHWLSHSELSLTFLTMGEDGEVTGILLSGRKLTKEQTSILKSNLLKLEREGLIIKTEDNNQEEISNLNLRDIIQLVTDFTNLFGLNAGKARGSEDLDTIEGKENDAKKALFTQIFGMDLDERYFEKILPVLIILEENGYTINAEELQQLSSFLNSLQQLLKYEVNGVGLKSLVFFEEELMNAAKTGVFEGTMSHFDFLFNFGSFDYVINDLISLDNNFFGLELYELQEFSTNDYLTPMFTNMLLTNDDGSYTYSVNKQVVNFFGFSNYKRFFSGDAINEIEGSFSQKISGYNQTESFVDEYDEIGEFDSFILFYGFPEVYDLDYKQAEEEIILRMQRFLNYEYNLLEQETEIKETKVEKYVPDLKATNQQELIEKKQADKKQKKKVEGKVNPKTKKVLINVKGEEKSPLLPAVLYDFQQKVENDSFENPKTQQEEKASVARMIGIDFLNLIQETVNATISEIDVSVSKFIVTDNPNKMLRKIANMEVLWLTIKKIEMFGNPVLSKVADKLYSLLEKANNQNMGVYTTSENFEMFSKMLKFFTFENTLGMFNFEDSIIETSLLIEAIDNLDYNSKKSVQEYNFRLGQLITNKNFFESAFAISYAINPDVYVAIEKAKKNQTEFEYNEMLILNSSFIMNYGKRALSLRNMFGKKIVRKRMLPNNFATSNLTLDQLFETARGVSSFIPMTEGQKFILGIVEKDFNTIRNLVKDARKEGKKVELPDRLKRWFTRTGDAKEDLRTAILLYVRGQAPASNKEARLLGEFMEEFGVLQTLKEAKFVKEFSKEKIIEKDKNVLVINPDFMPTFLYPLYNKFKALNINLVIPYIKNTQASLSGFLLQDKNELLDLVVYYGYNLSSPNSQNKNKYTAMNNTILHEFFHAVFVDTKINDKTTDLQIKELRQALYRVSNNLFDYLKRKGLYAEVMRQFRQYYPNIDIRMSWRESNENKGEYYLRNYSVEEEILVSFLAWQVDFDGKENEYLLSILTYLQNNFKIIKELMVFGEDVDYNLNEGQEAFKENVLQNNEKLTVKLEEKVSIKPNEPQQTKKQKFDHFKEEVIVRTQNAQKAIENAFAALGLENEGKVLVNSIRAAKNAGQMSIAYGIADPNTGRFLSRPLYGAQTVLKKNQAKQTAGFLDFLIDAPEQKYAAFSVYAHLWNNISRTNLRKEFVLGDVEEVSGVVSQDTIRRLKDFVIGEQFAEGLEGEEWVLAVREKLTSLGDVSMEPELLDKALEQKIISQKEYDEILYQTRYAKEIFGKFISIDRMPVTVVKRIMELMPNLYRGLTQSYYLSQSDVFELIDKDISLDPSKSPQIEKAIVELVKPYLLGVNKEQSEQLIKEYDAKYPEFKKAQEELVNWYRSLRLLMLDAGLISQTEFDWMEKTYPNYIPSLREALSLGGIKSLSGKNNLTVKNPIKTATGSDLVLESIDVVAARKTLFVHHEAAMNKMLRAIYRQYVAGGSQENDYVVAVDKIATLRRTSTTQEIEFNKPLYVSNANGSFVTFYDIDEDGERVQITMKVSDLFYVGLQQLNQSFDDRAGTLGRAAKKTMKVIKSGITNYDPSFTIRNLFRDIQDAFVFSKFSFVKWVRELPKSLRMQYDNDPMWQEYVANGGIYASLFEYNQGVQIGDVFARTRLNKPGKFAFLRKPFQAIERMNMFFEQGTRFNEYRLAREAGYSIQEAILMSNEVTVNFGRTGTITETLNSTVSPFLNPKVQGFERLIRVWISPKSAKEWVALILRYVMLGILPDLFNALVYSGDPDYENLPDYLTEQNYLIKVGGKFIKIPKGRALGTLTNVLTGVVKGKDYSELLERTWNDMSPIANFRFIWSPFDDVRTNTTWFGGKIVSTKWDQTRPANQFTDDTSWFAKQLGQLLGYSPLKIDYLLQQYTGIVYDAFLNTSKTRKDILVDPTYTNSYSNQFYKFFDEANYDRTDGDMIARAQVAYLNRIIDSIGDLYTEIELLRASGLPQAEFEQQAAVIQAMINATYAQALENVKLYGEELKEYELSEESYEDDVFAATRNVFGSEYALRYYNYQVHRKAVVANALGFDFDQYFDYYFTLQMFPTKELKVNYINRLRAPVQVKQLLYKFAGYKIDESTVLQIKRILLARGLDETFIDDVLNLEQ